jgi:hypothetical protein
MNRLVELINRGFLGQQRGGPGLQHGLLHLLVSLYRQANDIDVGIAVLNDGSCIDAVHFRHVNVHHDDGRLMHHNADKRLFAIRCFAHHFDIGIAV